MLWNPQLCPILYSHCSSTLICQCSLSLGWHPSKLFQLIISATWMAHMGEHFCGLSSFLQATVLTELSHAVRCFFPGLLKMRYQKVYYYPQDQQDVHQLALIKSILVEVVLFPRNSHWRGDSHQDRGVGIAISQQVVFPPKIPTKLLYALKVWQNVAAKGQFLAGKQPERKGLTSSSLPPVLLMRIKALLVINMAHINTSLCTSHFTLVQ